MRYWQETPIGSALTGPAGLLPNAQLPTSLAGIGGVNARADFGYFWGPSNANGMPSYIGGNVMYAQVVQNAAPNPVGQAWPAPAGTTVGQTL